jgi:hypothetical protein
VKDREHRPGQTPFPREPGEVSPGVPKPQPEQVQPQQEGVANTPFGSPVEQKRSDTAAYSNKVEDLRIQIAPLPIMRFFRSGMSSEAYVELENSICREVIEGSTLLGISEAEYVQRIGISRSFSHRPGKKRGARL